MKLKNKLKKINKLSWTNLWRGNPPGFFLLLIGVTTSLIMVIPIIYVVISSIGAGTQRWMRLLDSRIPKLLYNTLTLSFSVTFFAVVLGVSLAFIVHKTNLPGKKIWQWLLALPLVIPPYVGAVTYIIVAGRSGWLKNLWDGSQTLINIFGNYKLDIYSFWGVTFVMTMFTYPYVYLITTGALRKMNQNYEEAARSKGASSTQIFLKITLPLLRPAIGAGAILVFLYVLSDFGAISILRYTTFTSAIYFQRTGFDTASASVLSLVLILITLIVLWIESKTKARGKYYQTTNSFRKPKLINLKKSKIPSLLYVILIFSLSVVLPVSVLIYWSGIGLSMGAIDSRFFGFAFNSFILAISTAIIAAIISLPIVYLKSRHNILFSRIIEKLSYIGYTLPGVIVALGFVFIFNNYLTFLYATPVLLVIAFFVRFLPQSLQANEASLDQISPRIDEAARSLGCPPWKIIFKVIYPNMIPGILAGAALTFVSTIKELPVTLMLRPPGYDTLAVRVYFEAHDGIYHMAAPAALLIILVSIIPLRYMIKKN